MSKNTLAIAALLSLGFAGVASAEINPTVKKGSSRARVEEVQAALNACNDAGLSEDGLWGAKTTAAVKAFQADNGISRVGFVGPATAAALNDCADDSEEEDDTTTTTTTTDGNTTTTTTTTTLTGPEGNLTNVNKLGLYNNTKANEGAKDVKVYAVEMTAKDGDQKIDGFNVAFKNVGSGSVRFTRVASEVSIWLDGVEIGRKLATQFSDDAGDVYSFRFSGMNGIVKKDQKSTLVVAVSPVTSFDSADVLSDNWSVEAGTTIGTNSNYISAASANGRYRDFGADLAIASIDFQKATGEATWKVTSSSTNPVARNVQISKTADTTDVTLLAFDVKAENAAMLLQKLPVTVTVSNTGSPVITSAQTVVKNVKLYMDGTLVTSESAPTGLTGTVLFGNSSKLQKALSSNTTVKVEVRADLASRGVTATYGEGTTVQASYSTSGLSVELDNFNKDTVTNMTGSATGELQTLRSTGVQVSMGSATFEGATNNLGEVLSRTVKIPVTIKAFDDTMYVNTSAVQAAASVAGNGSAATSFVVEGAAGTTLAVPSTATWTSTDATIEGGVYRIDAGSTKNFTLTVLMTGATGQTQKQYRVQLNDVSAYNNVGLLSASNGQIIQALTPANSFESTFTTLNSAL